MIPILGLMNLDNELILNFKWCSTSLQPYTHVFWVRTATQLVGFPPKQGLALYYRSRIPHTRVLVQNIHKTSQFPSEIGTGLIENDETGVEIHL